MNKKKSIAIMLSITFLIMVLGMSYAFFIYNKEGLYTHTINGGKMKVIYDELAGNNIMLENAYPLTDEEALEEAIEFEFSITGYNESDKAVYYSIEMDHGDDLTGFSRFRDSDIKLTLYENDELVYENEIFDNLDNQGVYYGIIRPGTSSQAPVVNNYKMRLWINDMVLISETMKYDLQTWDDHDWDWLYGHYDESWDIIDGIIYEKCYDFWDTGEGECSITDLGFNVYTSDEFENNFASFKVNVKANLSGDDIGMLWYDANGGVNEPNETSLSTNRVTMQKPVMEGKAFLGWSSNKDSIIPEYKSGDHYSGNGQMLYAIYGDTRNVMGTFPDEILDISDDVMEVHFVDEVQSKIDSKYDSASIKADLTLDNRGSVKCWFEDGFYDEYMDYQYYNLYIASDGVTYLSDGYELFYDWENLEVIDLANAETSMVTNMESMFSKIPVYELNLESINTMNVEDISSMFSNCYNVSELNVSHFDMNKVVDASQMFAEMYNIIDIKLGDFKFAEGADISYMFAYLPAEILDVSGFDVTNVSNISGIFFRCFYVKKLEVSNWNINNCTSLEGVFLQCETLKHIDVSNWDTTNITTFLNLFAGCKNLLEINVSNFDTSNATNMAGMFFGCESLKKLNITNFNTGQVTDMSYMFSGGFFNEEPSRRYDGCAITTIDLSEFDTSNVLYMDGMFNQCRNLRELDLSNFSTENVVGMQYLFARCDNLSMLNIDSFDTSNVTNMASMFSACTNLTSLDLNHFDTNKVTNMQGMFFGTKSLTELYIDNFVTTNVIDMSYMFAGGRFESESTFYSGCGLSEIDLSHFNTSNLLNTSFMFDSCYNLISLNLSSFDTSKVTNMTYMFIDCYNLRTLNISNFTFTNVTSYNQIFRNTGTTSSGYTTIYVKSATEQTWIRSLSTTNRPNGWSNSNILIKG